MIGIEGVSAWDEMRVGGGVVGVCVFGEVEIWRFGDLVRCGEVR